MSINLNLPALHGRLHEGKFSLVRAVGEFKPWSQDISVTAKFLNIAICSQYFGLASQVGLLTEASIMIEYMP